MAYSGPSFSVILAATPDGAIGKDNGLPFRFKEDMDRFTQLTTGSPDQRQNVVIMGRKTWESIPVKFRPLPNRRNVVLTSDKNISCGEGPHPDASTNEFPSSLDNADAAFDPPSIWVMGGARLYEEALRHPGCQSIYLTKVLEPEFPGCDTFVDPSLLPPPGFCLVPGSDAILTSAAKGYKYQFLVYERIPDVGDHQEERDDAEAKEYLEDDFSSDSD